MKHHKLYLILVSVVASPSQGSQVAPARSAVGALVTLGLALPTLAIVVTAATIVAIVELRLPSTVVVVPAAAVVVVPAAAVVIVPATAVVVVPAAAVVIVPAATVVIVPAAAVIVAVTPTVTTAPAIVVPVARRVTVCSREVAYTNGRVLK